MPGSTNQSFLYRGGGFALDTNGSVTLASANTTKSAAGTMQLVNGFVNPAKTSAGTNDPVGRWCSILYASIAIVSGTPAGPFFWNFLTLPSGVTVTTAATGTVNSALIGVSRASNVKPLVNAAVVLSNAGTTAFTQLGTIGGPAAVGAGVGVYSVSEATNGRIVVPPGTVFGITATGAGTTTLVQSTIYWEELDSEPTV